MISGSFLVANASLGGHTGNGEFVAVARIVAIVCAGPAPAGQVRKLAKRLSQRAEFA